MTKIGDIWIVRTSFPCLPPFPAFFLVGEKLTVVHVATNVITVESKMSSTKFNISLGDLMLYCSDKADPADTTPLPKGLQMDLQDWEGFVKKTWSVDEMTTSDLVNSIYPDVRASNTPKCECGTSSVGGDKHSSWCPIK